MCGGARGAQPLPCTTKMLCCQQRLLPTAYPAHPALAAPRTPPAAFAIVATCQASESYFNDALATWQQNQERYLENITLAVDQLEQLAYQVSADGGCRAEGFLCG